jgi:DNA-binding transcriptional ArsR family regulator
MVLVRCPHCGRTFEVDLRKGKGAYYTVGEFKPSKLHELIMLAIRDIVREKGRGALKGEIERWLLAKGRRVSGNSVSGRLSELLGAGYVEVEYTKVQVYDEKSKKFRFKRSPRWYLTQRAVEYLRARDLA